MKIKLVARGGSLVTHIVMPEFKPLPRGVLRGSRTFFLKEGEWEGSPGGDLMPIYEEDILWVDPSQLKVVKS